MYGDKEELDFEDLNKLVYLEQCIKECLRMHPPAQLSSRRSPNVDFTVEGLLIPKGESPNIIDPALTYLLDIFFISH